MVPRAQLRLYVEKEWGGAGDMGGQAVDGSRSSWLVGLALNKRRLEGVGASRRDVMPGCDFGGYLLITANVRG
jgi:hypothetical protein